MNWKAFFESPENRTGFAIWAGTAVTALLQHFLLHEALSSADLLGLVLGFVKIVQPENTVTVTRLQGAIVDAKTLLTATNFGNAGKLAADAEAILGGMAGKMAKN